MLGVAVGFVVVAPLVALLGWLSGSGPMGAVGLGVFVGSWGGAGFGGMLGATIAVIRHETATPAFLPNPSAVGYRDAA
jgi:hypothetical protein